MRDGATCQGFYLLMFYISIANLKRSDICVWEGRVRGGGGAWERDYPQTFSLSAGENGGRTFPVY